MEGYKDIYWQGDAIAWKGLFKHYLLCLINSLLLSSLAGDDFIERERKIIPEWTSVNLPTDIFREAYAEVWERFVKNFDIDRLVDRITQRRGPIKKAELNFYLQRIHLGAIDSIRKQGDNFQFFQMENWDDFYRANSESKAVLDDSFFENLNALENEEALDSIFSVGDFIPDIQALTLKLENYQRCNHFLFTEYPGEYIKSLDQLIYRQSYIACFSDDPNNFLMWSHYASGHTGVCLKFAVNEDSSGEYALPGCRGEGAKFYQMNYDTNLTSINFFHSIGIATVADLKEFWFKDGDQVSSSVDHVFNSENDWRRRYYEDYFSTITTKLPIWQYEGEYRLILTDTLNQYNGVGQKLKYSASSLVGVIFGINATKEDKRKIIDILKDNFDNDSLQKMKIYQASYRQNSREIIHRELADLSRALLTSSSS